MEVHTKNIELLKDIKKLISKDFPALGVNKAQELVRLVFEISKRDSRKPSNILSSIETKDFHKIKDILLKTRFPQGYLNRELNAHLPKLELDPGSIAKPEKHFYPKDILIEEASSDSSLANSFKKAFSESSIKMIPSLKSYLEHNKRFSIKDYNKRLDTVFITNEMHDLFKRCPCTKKAVCCGYNIFNLSFGCIYDCTYCYLQEYTNTPGIIFPSNLDKFFDSFKGFKKCRMRIGTGEFSDSLMLDDITGYSLHIIDFFKDHTNIRFEFKTKSKNIKNLLNARHAGNIVASWSLNPQKMIDENEFSASSLSERLEAMALCAQAGYKIGIHFDPVIYFIGWEKEYKKLIDALFSRIKPKHIAWISIGTLRFNPKVKTTIEKRFPYNTILDGELLKGFDNKLRYPYALRRSIYEKILEALRKHSKDLPIYLCMEHISMWKELALTLNPSL
ncbi:MAG: spore photoproduct lyase family protein [Candidatus Omnitrophota bacterium]